MGRAIYQRQMTQRLRDLTMQIDGVRTRLEESGDDRLKVELAGELASLQTRRDRLAEKLAALEGEPEGTWAVLKGEIEEEWDTLVQDVEERLSGLA